MLGLDPDNLPEKLSIQKKVEDFEKMLKISLSTSLQT